MTKGSAPVMNLTYDGATNRVNSTHGFGYDASGNTTAMPGKSMSYDYDNRLAMIQMGTTERYGGVNPKNETAS